MQTLKFQLNEKGLPLYFKNSKSINAYGTYNSVNKQILIHLHNIFKQYSEQEDYINKIYSTIEHESLHNAIGKIYPNVECIYNKHKKYYILKNQNESDDYKKRNISEEHIVELLTNNDDITELEIKYEVAFTEPIQKIIKKIIGYFTSKDI